MTTSQEKTKLLKDLLKEASVQEINVMLAEGRHEKASKSEQNDKDMMQLQEDFKTLVTKNEQAIKERWDAMIADSDTNTASEQLVGDDLRLTPKTALRYTVTLGYRIIETK